jgi:uncharacterized membrane protein YedE/YeeE
MAFTPLPALIGGALIGLSASTLLVFDGRVAGISGILGGLFRPRAGEAAWRVAFLAGLLAAGVLLSRLVPAAVAPREAGVHGIGLVVAGLLVGVGTQLGGGCTSGHGVCGLSRWSARSLVAVVTFIATGAIAVFAVQHLLPRLG